MSIIVTGATGHLGRLIVESLLNRGIEPAQITATGRSLEKLADLAERGVATAAFDFDAPAEGVIGAGDTVMLVSGSEVGQRARQHGNVIEAAKKAGAARIVYTSILDASGSPLVLAPEHKATEELLAASGLPHTILRNGWYTENYLSAFGQAAATGTVLGSAGEGRVSAATRADYAEAAAAVLTADGHEGRVYELAGDEAFTLAGLADAFGQALGRDVAYTDVDADAHRAALAGAGLDKGTAGFLVALDADTAGNLLLSDSKDLSTLIGRPTTPLVDAVKSWAAESN
ncbi:SDR family oxidoreductase [Zafaria sp. Z1313]|uniref:SDR family oxidoreductase n=1 Tax=Zafaria sp. Z1313 TaxID=3423202 RepID=UPI003D30246C